MWHLSRNSSLSIATSWTVWVRFPAVHDFSLHNVHTGSGAHANSCRMGTWDSFPRGVKRQGRESDHSRLVPRSRIVELYLHSPIYAWHTA
jgi:hypothetical protein